jgi:hypothetical protein
LVELTDEWSSAIGSKNPDSDVGRVVNLRPIANRPSEGVLDASDI